MNVQMNWLDEIIVDNFAGGGGASTGIELAAGRPVNVAINHDPAAILMHKTNHPFTLHLQENVWNIDPQKVCAGRPVGLAWFSPDCKHFSKAKGKTPVQKNIRGLAWVVLRWAGTVRPRVIILENVEEFQTWGPVRKGKPVKSKQGNTFKKWLKQLRDLGYEIEYRELVAADYGAPTTRKRFVLIARCDGQPIVWPTRTHAPVDSDEVKCERCKPWLAAAEIIDWSLPCPSIFESAKQIKEKHGLTVRRPLKDNTLRRIIRGVDKFVIKSSSPFIVPAAEDGKSEGGSTTIATALHMQNNFGAGGADMRAPIHTITTGLHQMLIAPTLTEYFGNAQDALSLQNPLHTVTTKDREALTFAHLAEFKGQDKGQPANVPLRTITAGGGEFGAVYTTLVKASKDVILRFWPQVRELLNKFCGYSLTEDEILLIWIGGTPYFISDIGLRMLIPKELYRAQGFPEDYIIEKDYLGNKYLKTEQVARAGNAVCPPMAAALVRANFPEWCVRTITTMAQLKDLIAV